MDIIPIVVAAFTALAGLGIYRYQKWLDRKNSLVEIRRKAYRDYLESLSTYLITRRDEDRVAYQKASTSIFVVGEDRVIKAIGQFTNEFMATVQSQTDKERMEVVRLFCTIVRAMRQDCFQKSDLSDEEIMSFSPIKYEVPQRK